MYEYAYELSREQVIPAVQMALVLEEMNPDIEHMTIYKENGGYSVLFDVIDQRDHELEFEMMYEPYSGNLYPVLVGDWKRVY